MTDLLTFIIISLLLYMFVRLIWRLHDKGLLINDDIFYITSTPWEYKKYKKENQNNEEGS